MLRLVRSGSLTIRIDIGVEHRASAGRVAGNVVGKLPHIFHMIETSNAWRFRVLRSEFGTSPLLLGQIARRQKKNLGVSTRRLIPLRVRRRRNQQRYARLDRSRKIEKVIVLPESVKIVRTIVLRGRKQNHHAAHLLGERDAACAIVGVGLPVESKARRSRGKKENAAKKTRQKKRRPQFSHRVIHPHFHFAHPNLRVTLPRETAWYASPR